MKLIFLDVDGVLNHQDTKERWNGFIGINPIFVARLNQLLDDTGAAIVVSSSWRLDPDWKTTLTNAGIPEEKIIDKTPYLAGEIRGLEIQEWIANNGFNDKYVILDDNSDMLPGQPLFQTSWFTGLTDEIVGRVREYLNS